MGLKERIKDLEREAGRGRGESGWSPPIVEVRPGDDPVEVEARLKGIRQEALEAGWSGRGVCVVVVEVGALEVGDEFSKSC